MKTLKSILALVLSSALIMSCANWSNTGKGAAIGGGAGGVLGGIIGSKKGNTAAGAVIGAAVGGAAGAAIGKYMDKQAEELEELENAEVKRVGEGIQITFDSGILFGFDSYALTPQSQENVMKLAKILNDYPDTNIMIYGHTDSKGSEEYNQDLSEKRAGAVSNYLKMQGIDRNRLSTVGHGESMPVATNDTDAGRAKNRRVEVAITANEELIEKAENGELDNI
ncbi:OmpA family protein [Echinicola jeungdonensis]|uniref:OmpA family protein n=1 Tax=Echinicola jeungdonensis TaxID=709343 RepID=A0ABV5J816_9BACT|nr:OmpA family protein [Echinicola jeungdonensis]MDN3669970.1 OmpA family protein [Echinicola jeungdonensis]